MLIFIIHLLVNSTYLYDHTLNNFSPGINHCTCMNYYSFHPSMPQSYITFTNTLPLNYFGQYYSQQNHYDHHLNHINPSLNHYYQHNCFANQNDRKPMFYDKSISYNQNTLPMNPNLNHKENYDSFRYLIPTGTGYKFSNKPWEENISSNNDFKISKNNNKKRKNKKIGYDILINDKTKEVTNIGEFHVLRKKVTSCDNEEITPTNDDFKMYKEKGIQTDDMDDFIINNSISLEEDNIEESLSHESNKYSLEGIKSLSNNLSNQCNKIEHKKSKNQEDVETLKSSDSSLLMNSKYESKDSLSISNNIINFNKQMNLSLSLSKKDKKNSSDEYKKSISESDSTESIKIENSKDNNLNIHENIERNKYKESLNPTINDKTYENGNDFINQLIYDLKNEGVEKGLEKNIPYKNLQKSTCSDDKIEKINLRSNENINSDYSMELNDSYIENKKYFNTSEDISDKEIVTFNKKEIKNGKKFRKKKKQNEENKSKLVTEEDKEIKKEYFEFKDNEFPDLNKIEKNNFIKDTNHKERNNSEKKDSIDNNKKLKTFSDALKYNKK